MKLDVNEIIGNYLKEKNTTFTSAEFCSYLKDNGIKISIDQAEDLLNSSDFVFPLVDRNFITRAGVFQGQYFSFKPSKEEIDCGCFILGHRCMPFANPEVSPDNVVVLSDNKIIAKEIHVFSMNLALDTFALYGEGYAIPCIINDLGNSTVSLSSVQYAMPSEISLTCWPLAKLKGGKSINYGDRVICRIVDWENTVVDMFVEHEDAAKMIVTRADIEREDWYSNFETGILETLDRYGPTTSIEEQLAFLFLENQDTLCIRNCGSIEEFLSHTTKINFEHYGVETRIWKAGEVVPYIGKWNENIGKEQILIDLTVIFTPQIINSYIKNSIYMKSVKKSKAKDSLDSLLNNIIPRILGISPEEQNTILLNIKKRSDILEESYNPFNDYAIADVRERALILFSDICSLLCSIGFSCGEIEELPQQELVILYQLYGHLVRLMEEFDIEFNHSHFPIEDVAISLEGMEDTYEEVGGVMKSALEANKIKGFEIFSDNSEC